MKRKENVLPHRFMKIIMKENVLPHRFMKIIMLQRRIHHEQNLQSDLEQNEKLLRGGE